MQRANPNNLRRVRMFYWTQAGVYHMKSTTIDLPKLILAASHLYAVRQERTDYRGVTKTWYEPRHDSKVTVRIPDDGREVNDVMNDEEFSEVRFSIDDSDLEGWEMSALLVLVGRNKGSGMLELEYEIESEVG